MLTQDVYVQVQETWITYDFFYFDVSALLQQCRIAGGETASAAQYPFAAAIFSAHDSVTFELVCGGTILNSRSVMSATSCFM